MADTPMDARPFIPETKSLKRLAEAVEDCRGCPLYKNATHGVFGEGGKGRAASGESIKRRDGPRSRPAGPGWKKRSNV